MRKAELIREATKKDMKRKLKENHKCLLVRCTGFGKTWILAEITREYKKVLYLYPSEIVKNTAEQRILEEVKQIRNVDFMTYMMLIRKDLNDLSEYDLFIFDEAHKIGGEQTKEAVKELMALYPEKYFLGATATVERSDGYNIIEEIFDGSHTFYYTLHDAFRDGLVKKPYYYYCTYDTDTQIASDLKQAALLAGQDPTNIKVKEVLKKGVLEVRKIQNMPTIIKSVCNDHAVDTSCMKFLVFFSSIKHMHSKKDEFLGWVRQAYPNHRIQPLIISSESEKYSQNVNELSHQGYHENMIYVNCVIDMVNLGYHIADLTAIFMMRCTNSSTIFSQQLGRVINSGSDKPGIVFDIVDNIHRKAAYDLREIQKPAAKADPVPLSEKILTLSEQLENASEEERPALEKKIEQLKEKLAEREEKASYEKESDYWADKLLEAEKTGEGDLSYYEDKMMIALNRESEDYDLKDLNRLYGSDLRATKHEATYREIIAKTVAEPYAQRCKVALIGHINRRYLSVNNRTSVINHSDEDNLKVLGDEKFLNEIRTLLSKNKLDYPIDNPEKILNIGSHNDGLPLAVFAKWQNVSVKAVIDMIMKPKHWHAK